MTRPEAVALLQDHGILPTQQRVEIALVMFDGPQHLSAEDVMERVNREQTVASKATVYNTLGLLAKKGLIREVLVDPSRVFYDPNTSEHHHFYDVDSGQLMDIGTDQLAFSRLPEPPDGTVTDGVDVIIRVRSKGAEHKG